MKKTKQIKKQYRQGFITLFFVLGISFTFLTWIALSSHQVFEYIQIKKEFIKNRSALQNQVLCADAFINNYIKSRYNLGLTGNTFTFNRSLYFSDDYTCQIKNIAVYYNTGNVLGMVSFISGDFSFSYNFKNGSIFYSKSFNIF